VRNFKFMVGAVIVSAVTFGHSFARAEGDDAGIKSFNPAVSPASEGASAPTRSVSEPAVIASTKTDRLKNAGSRSLAVADGSPGLRAIVARHAAAEGVPFALADAVVRVESRYNPRASNKGNYGLMQIRHQTARGVGYGGSAAGLLDADTNARYGMKYLAQAYRMSGGDTCRTIMKYQSGHMATQMSGANRAYCAKVRTYVASR
jgi:soluble lytic murein transglycosylase-like protein